MKITVRCFFIPADITFDLDDVKKEVSYDKQMALFFKNGFLVIVDKQHYYNEKAKIGGEE